MPVSLVWEQRGDESVPLLGESPADVPRDPGCLPAGSRGDRTQDKAGDPARAALGKDGNPSQHRVDPGGRAMLGPQPRSRATGRKDADLEGRAKNHRCETTEISSSRRAEREL